MTQDIKTLAERIETIPSEAVDQTVVDTCVETTRWLRMVGPEWGIDHLTSLRQAAITVGQWCRFQGRHHTYLVVGELTRRLERQIGQNVKRLVKEERMLRKGSHRKDLPRFEDFIAGNNTRTDCAVFGSLSDEEFEALIGRGYEVGEMGARSFRRTLDGAHQDRPRNKNSDRAIREVIGLLDGVTAGLSVAHPADVSLGAATEFISAARQNIRTINRFIKEMSDASNR